MLKGERCRSQQPQRAERQRTMEAEVKVPTLREEMQSKGQKVNTIFILGRYWWGNINGNTEHTFQIWINGKHAIKSEVLGGYGSMYSQNATQWLKDNGYLPGLEEYQNGSEEMLRRYCDRNKIALVDTSVPVPRRKDL